MTPPRTTRLTIATAIVFVAVTFARGTLFSQVPAAPAGGAQAAGQAAPPGPPVTLKGTLERVKVHGKSLEGNLLGESAEPEVSIYLPPSYNTDRNRRYPVVYLLHGYTGTDLGYFGNNGGPRFLPAMAERVYAAAPRET